MPIQWDIQTFDVLDSTQSLAKDYAIDGAAEGLVIRALKQNAGKGRHGREWQHQKDNLAFSFILKPQTALQQIGQFAILTGVALAETCLTLNIPNCQLKWPNDLMHNNKKAAGILIETNSDQDQNLIIGIGVNTNTAPENAACLNIDSDQFLQTFLTSFAAKYETYKNEDFAPIREAWLKNTYPPGTPLNIGIFETMDEHGNIVVRGPQNTLNTYASGDVFLKEDHYASGH